MRFAVILVLVGLLAGCASSPAPPTAAPTTPPIVTPTPSPAVTPTVVSPAPEPAWRETNGAWTLEVEPGLVDAPYGSVVPFVATLRREGAPAPEDATFRMDSQWLELSPPHGSVPAEEGATLRGSLYVGAPGGLAAYVHEPDAAESIVFDGPPVVPRGVADRAPFERHRNVSDDAPGLDARAVDGGIRVTYAAEKNATMSTDERIAAVGDLVLVEKDGARTLVAFIMRSRSDAVTPLPEPERTRVVALLEGLAPGEVTVRVVSRVACFCFPMPAPTVEERTVTLR